MGLLGFERGVSTLAQQVGFARELDHVIDLARERGLTGDPFDPRSGSSTRGSASG